MKKYTDILWDFNGTLLDDVQIGIDSVNVLLEKRGLKTLESKEEYRRVFGFPIKEYYRRLGFDFEKESYEDTIAPLWVAEYQRRNPSAELCPGAAEALELFKSLGMRQTVISMSELVMLKGQIEALGIKEYFDAIYGLDNINAHSKLEIAKSWRAKNPNAVALMLGDTEHDFAVAQAIGADCILVAAGHEDEESLSKHGALVLRDLTEIKKYQKNSSFQIL